MTKIEELAYTYYLLCIQSMTYDSPAFITAKKIVCRLLAR